jgi:hypothetical protein
MENAPLLADPDFAPLLRHIGREEIPSNEDLLDGPELERCLRRLDEPPFMLVAVGDIMLGGRARSALQRHGPHYPFAAVTPLLRSAGVVLGNLEGPLAFRAERQARNFSYRVRPELAESLADAGINVVTLANNHLVDCGRAGVLETLGALERAGIARVGAGSNTHDAHAPAIFEAEGVRLGVLGYYWNRRCAATDTLPGSAMDLAEHLEADIRALRPRVDRIVATFHWGIPYQREPLVEDRQKARLAVELGADAVIGHHPHVIQPFEIHRGKPIFYSVGNFAFGSGNSRGEGLLLGLRFESRRTLVIVHPLYVKNRDPRIDYQVKVLRGQAARRVLGQLVEASGKDAHRLRLDGARGVLELPAGELCTGAGA